MAPILQRCPDNPAERRSGILRYLSQKRASPQGAKQSQNRSCGNSLRRLGTQCAIWVTKWLRGWGEQNDGVPDVGRDGRCPQDDCKIGVKMEHIPKGIKTLASTCLTVEVHLWLYVIKMSLLPTTHDATISRDRVMTIYCIMQGI